jgi:hypothetical protein
MRSEMASVFPRTWQFAARLDQLTKPGDYVATYVGGGEPVVVVRDEEGVLRAFSNVCRHHAARVGIFSAMPIFFIFSLLSIYLCILYMFYLFFYLFLIIVLDATNHQFSRGMWPHC